MGNPRLPGVSEVDRVLQQQLRTALLEKGSDYRPRTRHLQGDGSPSYTNRLILQTSPYLLQHAHNPVNWHPWGDEAFDRARAEGKPVLLSVGYSTCHWCHVMERESFEDEEIAAYLNGHYVAIKVDREERPDVDDVYMSAVQILTGRGGWPMTVLLTPDREPFFAGTYFPARDGDRGTHRGFLTILREMQQEFATRREALVARARSLSERIAKASAPLPSSALPGPEALHRAATMLARSFDAEWGGFGRAPKFPRPVALELLLRYHRRTGDAQALHQVLVTLQKMAAGGMYDQIGGGFHRYSTDRRWLVPHFEKMLYDNAQLVAVYLAAYQLDPRQGLLQVVRETLAYVAREMTSPDGAFYSATDADSPVPGGHEEEGYFFTWTPAELEAVLGKADARVVSVAYGVTAAGNFEGRNILHRPRPHAEVARDLDMSGQALRTTLERTRVKLLRARQQRPAPLRDEKVLTAWNGLMITAFARAALILDDPDYGKQAARAADFLLRELRTEDGRLLRSYRDGQAQHQGYLDDYACLIQALLDLYEATSTPRWLETALALQAVLDQHYWDTEHGGYFMTSDDHEKLLARDKPSYDGAEPSGNSVAAQNLLRLAEFTGQHGHRERAEKTLSAFAQMLARSPTGSPAMLSALDFILDTPLEVFLVSPASGGTPSPLLARFRQTFLPNRVFSAVTEGPELTQRAKLIPALEGKRALAGQTTAFVCERGRCQLPTSDPDIFAKQLGKIVPLEHGPTE